MITLKKGRKPKSKQAEYPSIETLATVPVYIKARAPRENPGTGQLETEVVQTLMIAPASAPLRAKGWDGANVPPYWLDYLQATESFAVKFVNGHATAREDIAAALIANGVAFDKPQEGYA